MASKSPKYLILKNTTHKNALVCWWSRAYAREQSPQERGQYEFAEQEAKARKVGLWREAEPIAP